VTDDLPNQNNNIINSHHTFSVNYLSNRSNNNSSIKTSIKHLDRQSLNTEILTDNPINNDLISDNAYEEPNINSYDFGNPKVNNDNHYQQRVLNPLPDEEENNRQLQLHLKQKLEERISELLGGIPLDQRNDWGFEDADDLLDRL